MAFNFPDLARQKKKDSNIASQYVFPDDLGQHCTHITFETYNYEKRKVRGGISPSRPSITLTDSIALPLPENMQEVSELRVRPEDLGTLGGGLGTEAYNAVKNFAGAVQGASDVTDVMEALPSAQAVKNLGQVGAASLVRQAIQATVPELQKGLEVGSGFSFNPYQALTFDGVNLRTFTFDWTLAASTRRESDTIKQIIQTIRKHIHPEYSGFSEVFGVGTTGRAFLKYPDIVKIKILGSPSGYMPIYKPGMISNFNVNYVGGGEIAFLEGGKPAVVKISMTMQEMEIWTREDYGPTTEESITINPTSESIFR